MMGWWGQVVSAGSHLLSCQPFSSNFLPPKFSGKTGSSPASAWSVNDSIEVTLGPRPC